jgi:hypothetical protein
MPDFTLTPDEDTHAPRQLRLVATGLADTAEVPTAHRGRPDPPPCYVPCEACGTLVLLGHHGGWCAPSGRYACEDVCGAVDAWGGHAAAQRVASVSRPPVPGR